MRQIVGRPSVDVTNAVSIPRHEEPVTVVLVDEQPLFREGLRNSLDSANGFEVVGEAATVADGVGLCLEHRPRLVLLGLRDTGSGESEAIELLCRGDLGCEVVVMATAAHDTAVIDALSAGARGYLLKSARPAEVVRALGVATDGHAVLDPAIARRLPRLLAPPAPRRPFPQLTERELQILELVAAGHNPETVARRLSLKDKTIRNNLSLIYTKIHVADRAQAVLKARAAGLGTADVDGAGLP